MPSTTIMQGIFGASRTAGQCRWLIRDQRGTAAVELALLATPLFLFLFAIVNAGHVLWLQNALDASVADAARCAAVNANRCGTADQIKTYAAGQSGAGFDSSVFSYAQPSCGKQVSASYRLTLPVVGGSLTLSARACYPS
jgi:Flp pilus assembly pilin Flp